MTLSFYDVSVASYLQVLTGAAEFLDQGHRHLVGAGVDPEEVVALRLYPDMLPFSFQVRSIAHHSQGALDGLRTGRFAPPSPAPPMSYVELLGLVTGAREALAAVPREEIEPLAGGEVIFNGAGYELRFTAPAFIASFSLPNFYFHVATAYDMLRMKGVPLGKRNYLGRMRFDEARKLP